jgi:hypothetical protein
VRGVAVDERLRDDYGLQVGDRVVLVGRAGDEGAPASADTVRIDAFVRRGADPSEVARAEYRVRLHLDTAAGWQATRNRVVPLRRRRRGEAATARARRPSNDAAFGFRAYRCARRRRHELAHLPGGAPLPPRLRSSPSWRARCSCLCILLLKIDERRRDVAPRCASWGTLRARHGWWRRWSWRLRWSPARQREWGSGSACRPAAW